MGLERILIRACCLAADSVWLPRLIAFFYPWAYRLGGKGFAERLVRLVVGASGYLLHRKGLKNNLHSYALDVRIKHLLASIGTVGKKPVRKKNGVLRIGFVGEMVADIVRPPTLVSQFPDDHQLHVFDLAWDGNFGVLPNKDNVRVSQYDLNKDYLSTVKALTKDINDAGLDMLIVSNYYASVKNDIIDGVDTPCIVNFSMGSHLSFHDKTDYSLYAQPRKNFFLKDNRLFSVFTNRPMRGELCYPETHVFHDREIDRTENPAWEDREPQMCFHGRLAQLNSPLFLDCMADILNTDSGIRFSFMGEGDELESILQYFDRRGLSRQVEYLGQVDRVCGNDQRWRQTILAMLRKSRLAPNPWPRGGGSSRVEAYAAGVPTMHLGMVTDGANPFDTRSQTVVDVPSLTVPSATVYSIDEYKKFCLKCLFDKEFSEQVIEEQYALVNTVTDHGSWWAEVLDIYDKWRNEVA